MCQVEDQRRVYITPPEPIIFAAREERKLTWSQKMFSMDVWIKTLAGIPCSGIGLGLLSGVFFATAGFIVKLIPLNPIEIVISRSVIRACIPK